MSQFQSLLHGVNHRSKPFTICSSAISSPSEHRGSQPDRPASVSALRVHNSNIERKPLQHQQSKIDLIDDTTLTSLPLPPPPAKRKRHTEEHDELRRDVDSTTDHLSEKPLEDTTMCSDLVDDTFDEADEADEPIVLVEDYWSTYSNNLAIQRQHLLLNFKRRVVSNSVPSAGQTCQSSKDDLEAVFGKIHGSEELKHCLICSKPLYEISSIISGTKKTLQLYQEFVCWSCIDLYEQFLEEVEAEFRESPNQEQMMETNRKLVRIFHLVIEAYGIKDSPQEKPKYSPDLIERLHSISERSDGLTMGWLLRLRSEIRKSWRLGKALPSLFWDNEN